MILMSSFKALKFVNSNYRHLINNSLIVQLLMQVTALLKSMDVLSLILKFVKFNH